MRLLALCTLALGLGFTAYSTPASANDFGGLKNVKTVMPNVLYRGGGTGGKEPIGRTQLNALCEGGFGSAIYAYKTGWTGDQSVSCGGGSLRYTYEQWDRPASAKNFLNEVYAAIQSGRSVYVHCWYGVHASGYLAAIALKQFCGYGDNEAVAYWDSHVPKSIRYPKVQAMVRDFQPSSSLQLDAGTRARVCP